MRLAYIPHRTHHGADPRRMEFAAALELLDYSRGLSCVDAPQTPPRAADHHCGLNRPSWALLKVLKKAKKGKYTSRTKKKRGGQEEAVLSL